MAITAIPITDYQPGAASWQLSPTISDDDFAPTLQNSITIGVHPVYPGGTLIPIVRSTGKAKDDSSDSVAGRLHTVTVSCEADGRDYEVYKHLLALERTPAHLLLTFSDNTRAFVAATEDSYLCSVERDGEKISVTLRIQNLMGIQMITPAL